MRGASPYWVQSWPSPSLPCSRSRPSASERRLPEPYPKVRHRPVAGESAAVVGAAALESSFPIGVPMRIAHWYRERSAMLSEIDRLRSFRFNVHATANATERQIYVLIIGEASRADHWGLYGYSRDTTPQLSHEQDLVRFTDIITPWSASRMAVPIIVSRKKGTDMQRLLRRALCPAALFRKPASRPTGFPTRLRSAVWTRPFP